MQHPSLSVSGQQVLITGASRGIGRALANGFAASGATVFALARPSDALQAVVAEIQGQGHRALAVPMNLTHDDIAQTLDELPQIDTVIHAAGMAQHQAVGHITQAAYQAVMALNVEAPLFLTQYLCNRWIETKSVGSVIFISSQLAHVGAPQRAVYCASKSAVEGYSRALAIELAAHGIRVNTVCPTFTETEMTQTMLADASFRQSVIDRIPLRRLGQPSDYLGACLLLASSAGALMTGTSLRVDGGWTAQ